MVAKKTLSSSFFDRPTLTVARDLLGKYLVRRSRGTTRALMITEVEAYDGPHDRASHAHRGRTPRNAVMFGEAGRFYVYFTYGMHWLANIVTGPRKYPAAVLLRGGTYENVRTREDARTKNMEYINGPARLTKFLRIDRAQNGTLASKRNGLWIEDRGVKIPRTAIVAQKRVGVESAGPVWANKKYNFALRRPVIFPAASSRSSRASRHGNRIR